LSEKLLFGEVNEQQLPLRTKSRRKNRKGAFMAV